MNNTAKDTVLCWFGNSPTNQQRDTNVVWAAVCHA